MSKHRKNPPPPKAAQRTQTRLLYHALVAQRQAQRQAEVEELAGIEGLTTHDREKIAGELSDE